VRVPLVVWSAGGAQSARVARLGVCTLYLHLLGEVGLKSPTQRPAWSTHAAPPLKHTPTAASYPLTSPLNCFFITRR
jgi:hypothetical protein